ncbi:MAG: gliding motility-associated peptidyl-prolyl isomerase GldI [Leeuwenhoekiella sp.]
MRRFLFLVLAAASLAACKHPEARRPVSQSGGSYIDSSVARNKEINEAEEKAIKDLMQSRPETEFLSSTDGFWYFYNTKDSLATQMPQTGDVVRYTYNLKKLSGETITSQEEAGEQTYQIDQSNQELMSGLRQGLKLMKPGETVTFLLPSHKAFGYYGLAGKIGANWPIQTTVTLIEIENSDKDD